MTNKKEERVNSPWFDKIENYSVEERCDKVVDYLSSLDNDGNFMDKAMINIMTARDGFIMDEVGKACIQIGVHVDEKRLKRWIEMCAELDNIPVELVRDMAIRNKLMKLENENRNLYHENRLLKRKLKAIEDAFEEETFND